MFVVTKNYSFCVKWYRTLLKIVLKLWRKWLNLIQVFAITVLSLTFMIAYINDRSLKSVIFLMGNFHFSHNFELKQQNFWFRKQFWYFHTELSWVSLIFSWFNYPYKVHIMLYFLKYYWSNEFIFYFLFRNSKINSFENAL